MPLSSLFASSFLTYPSHYQFLIQLIFLTSLLHNVKIQPGRIAALKSGDPNAMTIQVGLPQKVNTSWLTRPPGSSQGGDGEGRTFEFLSYLSETQRAALLDNLWREEKKKRTSATNGKGGGNKASAKAKQAPLRLDFHPLYREDAPKVILISSDGKAFCVDKQILSAHR